MMGMREKKSRKIKKNKRKTCLITLLSPHLKYGGRQFSGIREDRKQAGPSRVGEGTKLIGTQETQGGARCGKFMRVTVI